MCSWAVAQFEVVRFCANSSSVCSSRLTFADYGLRFHDNMECVVIKEPRKVAKVLVLACPQEKGCI